MPKGNHMSRVLIAALATGAVAAPAAVAQPIDMHATATTSQKSAQQDLRTEAAADPSRAPSYPRYVQGPPTWPMHPQPISSAPARVADPGDDGGSDLPIALIGIAGTLALGGGLTAAALRHRTRLAH
jgi:hypothetical protein